jgi:hypothetical protein
MAKKTANARMLETLVEVDAVNADLGHFLRFCLYNAGTVDRAHWGAYFTHAAHDLTADEPQLAIDLSIGKYLIGGGDIKEKRRLRRAVMLAKRAITQEALAVTSKATKNMNVVRLQGELNGVWRSSKSAAVRQITEFVIRQGTGQEYFRLFNALPQPEQDACLEAISDGLYQGDDSTEKFAADARATLLVLMRLNRANPPQAGTLAWLQARKATVVGLLLPALKNRIRAEWRGLMDRQPENVAMQTILTAHFLPGPMAFMQSRSVHPMDGVVPPAHDWTITDMNALNVPLISRVGFALRSSHEVGALNLVAIDSATRGSDIYFLPWKSGRVIRMTIPAAQGPSVFFTAAINGCSVFVTGNAQTPTVYHCGLEDELGSAFDDDSDPNLYVPASTGDSARFWRNLVKKLDGLTDTDILGEVNRNHYVKRTVAPLAPSTLDASPITERGVLYETTITGQAGIELKRLMVWGCVFGLRAPNGDWRFYLQENATSYYLDRANGDHFGTSRPIRVSRIFPTPTAIIQASPSHYANLHPNCNFVQEWNGTGALIPAPLTPSLHVLKNVHWS